VCLPSAYKLAGMSDLGSDELGLAAAAPAAGARRVQALACSLHDELPLELVNGDEHGRMSATHSLAVLSGGARQSALVVCLPTLRDWHPRPQGAGKVRGICLCGPQVRAGEGRAGEARMGEVRAVEVRAGEVRAGEVRAGEVRAGEVRAGEVRAAEVRAAEVRAGEVRAGEVDAPRTSRCT